MGLDQYAFARKDNDDIQIAYWRKHANLEGWMANLYHERGGEGDFNCVELRLFKSDLLALALEHDGLTVVSGFFWGESDVEDDESTLTFVEEATKMLEDGYEIIYTSWW